MNNNDKIKTMKTARVALGLVMLVTLALFAVALTLGIVRIGEANRNLNAIGEELDELREQYDAYEASGDTGEAYLQVIEEHNELLATYRKGQTLRNARVFVWCISIGVACACLFIVLLRFLKLNKTLAPYLKAERQQRKAQRQALQQTMQQTSVVQPLFENRPVNATYGQDDVAETLRKLKAMVEEGLITQEDYDAKKTELLNRM